MRYVHDSKLVCRFYVFLVAELTQFVSDKETNKETNKHNPEVKKLTRPLQIHSHTPTQTNLTVTSITVVSVDRNTVPAFRTLHAKLQ